MPGGGLGKRSACLVASCCDSGRSPKRLCGQGCEPGKTGDDARALEQPAKVDEPGRLAEARTGQGHGREHGHGGAGAVQAEAGLIVRSQDRQPLASAAAGRPANTGTAARLWAMPVRLGWVGASGVPGG